MRDNTDHSDGDVNAESDTDRTGWYNSVALGLVVILAVAMALSAVPAVTGQSAGSLMWGYEVQDNWNEDPEGQVGETDCFTLDEMDVTPLLGQYSVKFNIDAYGCGIADLSFNLTENTDQPDSLSVGYYRSIQSGDEYFGLDGMIEIEVQDGVIRTFNDQGSSAVFNDTGMDHPVGEWRIYEFSSIDYTSQTYDLTVKTPEGTVVGVITDVPFTYDSTQSNAFYVEFISTEGEGGRIDGLSVDGEDYYIGPATTGLGIDTRSFIQTNQTVPYSVFEKTNAGTYDVTNESVVTSGNTTLLSVDQSNATLSATNNTNISGNVNITANYTEDGETVTTTKEIAVGCLGVSNLALLPSNTWRFSGLMFDGCDSGDKGYSFIFTLLIATFFAVAATRFATAFAGLAVGQMVLVIGWFAGFVGFGMAAVSVFITLFIGLNVAENISYQSGRIRS